MRGIIHHGGAHGVEFHVAPATEQTQDGVTKRRMGSGLALQHLFTFYIQQMCQCKT